MHGASQPIDFLILGHLTKDLTSDGYRLGGTAAYAGLTAARLGRRVALVTSCGEDLDLSPLSEVTLQCKPSDQSTTFVNLYRAGSRSQRVEAQAMPLTLEDIPPAWRQVPVVLLGPVLDEVDPGLLEAFQHSFVALTPQGWLRRMDEQGKVSLAPWVEIARHLPRAKAVILSMEDLAGDEAAPAAIARHCGLLVVTDGRAGARLFVGGIERRIPAPEAEEVDPTGAGDIFAAVFLHALQAGHDPRQACEMANAIAARSVQRRGLDGVPRLEELRHAKETAQL